MMVSFLSTTSNTTSNWSATPMNEDLEKIKELEALRAQHRDLDNQINDGGLDEFTLRRFKQVKLALRDRISMLERIVYPDIIA